MPFSWAQMMIDLGHEEFAILPDFPPQPRVELIPPSEATIGVFTSCGAYLNDHIPFEPINDLSYRLIPREIAVSDVYFAHPSPIGHFAREDLNVAYPRDRLVELEAEGAIGKLAPQAVSMLGSITRYEELVTATVPEIKAEFDAQGVDFVLLFPFCPACHRATAMIARGLEARGLPTVTISLLREMAEAFKPPRVAFLDFPLGATVGKPNDPALQRSILAALLGLVPEGFAGDWAIQDLPFQWSEDGNRDWEGEVRALYAADAKFISERVGHHTDRGDRLEGREQQFAITCNC